jgi:hypothetical protein
MSATYNLPRSCNLYNQIPINSLHNTVMTTSSWREKQLQWLARGHEVGRRQLDSTIEFEEFPEPAPSQVALLQIFTDALDDTITPQIAATRTSNWVLSVPDTDACYDVFKAYANMTGVFFAATQQLSSPRHLNILADLAVCLGSLPDAYNTSDKTLEWEGYTISIPPGDRIQLPCGSGGALWSDLPDFESRIASELSRGPQSYFNRFEARGYDQREIHCQAENRYANINTFAALVALRHPPQGSQLCSCLRSAFTVMAFLEHGPGTERGKWAHLAVRAAAIWISAAGEELVAFGPPPFENYYFSGSLWEAEGGADTMDVERLRFWKSRFLHFRESGELVSSEAEDAVDAAVIALDRLIAKQG